MVRICKKLSNHPKSIYHFAFPLAMNELLLLDIFWDFQCCQCFGLGHSTRDRVASHCFNVSYLRTRHWHLFIYLFDVCILSLLRCLFRSFVHFLLLNLKCILYILNPLSEISIANISSNLCLSFYRQYLPKLDVLNVSEI
jgi:hypothetical protein